MDHYSKEVLDRAIYLKTLNLNWVCVAERMGLKPDSLMVMVSRYKCGKLKFTKVRHKKNRDEMIEMFENGYRVCEIARLHGVLQSAVVNKLAYHGIDKEERDKIKKRIKSKAQMEQAA